MTLLLEPSRLLLKIFVLDAVQVSSTVVFEKLYLIFICVPVQLLCPLRTSSLIEDLCFVPITGDLDLAENGDGRWRIEIQAIQCPVGNGKIEYKFQGSNPWYLKLQIRNARYASAVCIKELLNLVSV